MDVKEFDKLRKKINIKDFEGNNKGLDKWLYVFSYIGNISAIFFAYFLVYPSLLKAITLNFVTGLLGTSIAFIFTIIFLTIFEIIKRYLIRNSSSDYLSNKLNGQIFTWLTLSLGIIVLSFYLSITGSKNLATTSLIKNSIAESEISMIRDSLTITYNDRKKIYEFDNEALRKINNDLRNTLAETPVSYVYIRKDYQISIDKNIEIINANQKEINKINDELNVKILELRENLVNKKSGNQTEDHKNIFLFIIIVVFNELIIIGGVFFREYFEYNLFKLNREKFEKIYQKKDRYMILTTYIYNNGSMTIGDKVISGLDLKKLISEKTSLSNRFVDEYLYDMDNAGIFSIIGKRRYIAKTYQEALNIIEKFENTLHMIENMK